MGILNKKNNEENTVVDSDKIKLSEKISVKLRRTFLVNRTITLLIVLILISTYIAINLWITKANLPEIDVTENKLYSLSDESKKVIKDINQEIKFYAYGIEDDSPLMKFLRQYSKVNEKITCEVITEQTNYDMVQKYTLSSGYQILIVQSEDSEKIIDTKNDFITYDNTTFQSVDITEQVLTNTILGLVEKNKPSVYFLTGHGEYEASKELLVINTYLNNESFKTDTLDLMTAGNIPEDCNILAIMGIATDLMDNEVAAIQDFINKGGNLYIGVDVLEENTELPNLQRVLDNYGVSITNGYILEGDEANALKDYPYIFKPNVSMTNPITDDIYTDSFMYLVYASKLNIKSDEELKELNVTKDILLSTSEDAFFVTDFKNPIKDVMENASKEKYDIAALFSKVVSTEEDVIDQETGDILEVGSKIKSELIVSASSSFATDYQISAISQTYPLSYIGSNKDFVINSMAYLGEKENSLSIRKDMSSASGYTASDNEKIIVKTICFSVPLIIIAVGIIISTYRKKRK